MATNDHWIANRVAEARERDPLVTEAASERIAVALGDQLSEQQLSNADLTSLAKELISDMIPASPRSDAS